MTDNAFTDHPIAVVFLVIYVIIAVIVLCVSCVYEGEEASVSVAIFWFPVAILCACCMTYDYISKCTRTKDEPLLPVDKHTERSTEQNPELPPA